MSGASTQNGEVAIPQAMSRRASTSATPGSTPSAGTTCLGTTPRRSPPLYGPRAALKKERACSSSVAGQASTPGAWPRASSTCRLPASTAPGGSCSGPRSASHRLHNCTFEEGDALALDRPTSSVDAIVVSRLFIVLAEGDRVIEEIHRVLKPGGRCFVAEPRSAIRAAVPLYALRLRARLSELYGKAGTYGSRARSR